MDVTNLFWNATVDEMTNGYQYNKESGLYICIICGKTFSRNEVYAHGEKLLTAEGMVKAHIKEEHNSVLDYLLSLNKKYTGLSDVQKHFISYECKGLSDQDIAKAIGVSVSTIRNYRFKLREKEKQAKIMLCLSALLKDDKELIAPHKTATMVDDRYVTTKKEEENVLKNFFEGEDGNHLKLLPSKEKKKIIVLRKIISNFKVGKQYSEKEINRVLERIYDDFALIRRYLIQYGFLERSDDGKYYWVKEV